MGLEELTQAESDWDNRVLCSDGRCTGVIGPTGRCGECGARYETGPGDETPAVLPEVEIPFDANTDVPEAIPIGEEAADDDWESRVLCSDSGCIGIIGPDGRCKECGLPHDPS